MCKKRRDFDRFPQYSHRLQNVPGLALISSYAYMCTIEHGGGDVELAEQPTDIFSAVSLSLMQDAVKGFQGSGVLVQYQRNARESE